MTLRAYWKGYLKLSSVLPFIVREEKKQKLLKWFTRALGPARNSDIFAASLS